MTKKFASQADLDVKKTTFAQMSEHCWAYTAEGDPNTGVIIGDDSVLICDALATPVMAQSLIAEIRKITDKPIKYVVLSHYHAVRVLGASGYKAAGMQEIIASQGTYEMIVERGAQDMQSEYERFPRLFDAFDSIPGLTWPTLVFKDSMTLWMGKLEVKIMHLGAGHTKGDTVVWVPSEKVLFSGDLVEADAAMTVGQLAPLGGRQRGRSGLGLEDDEVVAQPVHLGEFDAHGRKDTPSGRHGFQSNRRSVRRKTAEMSSSPWPAATSCA